MKKYACPCCHSEEQVEIDLHSEGFVEDLFECGNCGAEWVVKHGAIEIIIDSNSNSFLELDEDCTDGTCPNIV